MSLASMRLVSVQGWQPGVQQPPSVLFDTYVTLPSLAGKRAGLWAIVPFQLVVSRLDIGCYALLSA